jgi:hypothetical protein
MDELVPMPAAQGPRTDRLYPEPAPVLCQYVGNPAQALDVLGSVLLERELIRCGLDPVVVRSGDSARSRARK